MEGKWSNRRGFRGLVKSSEENDLKIDISEIPYSLITVK